MLTLFTLAAIVGGTVLLIQFVLMLLGLDDGGSDVPGAELGDLTAGADVGGDGGLSHGGTWFYEVLSLRTLSAGATFFGIAGRAALVYGYSPLGSFVLASVAGAAALYAVYWMFKQIYKMQHAGNENIRNAIGAPATVYVPIPAKRGGAGKVTFRLQNRLVEYQAITDDDERLATGEKVVVVAIVNSDTVRVSRAEAAASGSTAPAGDMARSI